MQIELFNLLLAGAVEAAVTFVGEAVMALAESSFSLAAFFLLFLFFL